MNHKKYWESTRVKGAYRQGRKDAIEEMTLPIDDYKKIERLMCRYFNNADISKEKTDMEKLALEIVCIGMQTIGHLIQELEENNG